MLRKARKSSAREWFMQKIAQIISQVIDFFYRPFRRIVPKQLFRYGVCGGANLVLDWVLYFLVYHVLALPLSEMKGGEDGVIHIGSMVAITPHIFSLCVVFPITLLTGFWLNRYVTFTESTLRGSRQLVRYLAVVGLNLSINYFGLKLCVETLGWYPTVSKMAITILTVAISFFAQKYFSFRK